MQTRRNHQNTPRKGRLWVTTQIGQIVSQAGVASTAMGIDFREKVGREFLPTDTLDHTWLKGVYTHSTAGDSSFEHFALGIGFFTAGVDANDLPDVLRHDGDWQMHDARSFRDSITVQSPLIPIQLAALDIESAGKRSVPRGGAASYELFFTAKSLNAPSSGSFEIVASITALWLV